MIRYRASERRLIRHQPVIRPTSLMSVGALLGRANARTNKNCRYDTVSSVRLLALCPWKLESRLLKFTHTSLNWSQQFLLWPGASSVAEWILQVERSSSQLGKLVKSAFNQEVPTTPERRKSVIDGSKLILAYRESLDTHAPVFGHSLVGETFRDHIKSNRSSQLLLLFFI